MSDYGTTEMLPLFDQPGEPKGRFAAWCAFHLENPGVWRLFVRFAEEALQARRTYFGARIIGERIRWYTMIETTGSEYKLNDHIWPYYSRLLMSVDGRFDGMFSMRDAKFDSSCKEIVRFHRTQWMPRHGPTARSV